MLLSIQQKYYKLYVDDELLRNIFKCLCICKEFKMLYYVFRNVKRKNAIVTKLLRSKDLNDDKVENIIKAQKQNIDKNACSKICEFIIDEIRKYSK